MRSSSDHDSFDLAMLRAHRAVKELVYFDTLESTNDLAVSIVRERNPPEPVLVLTANQTAGRGQQSRKWHAGEGSLTFSLIVPRALLDPAILNIASLAVGVACVRGIGKVYSASSSPSDEKFQATNCRLQLKWPNDLVVQSSTGLKKLGGILIESIAAGSGEGSLVAGVGVNVGCPSDGSLLPEDVADRAIYLSQMVVDGVEMTLLLSAILDEIFSVLNSPAEELLMEVNRLSVLRDRLVECRLANSELISGDCEGIDASGCLLIKGSDGVTHSVASGRITKVG